MTDVLKAQKIEYINKFRFHIPHQAAALDVMRKCMDSTKYGGEPLSAVVAGDSDAGKSETIKMFMREHPDVEAADRTLKPVIGINLREVVTTKNFAHQILPELGEPFPKGSLVELGDRIVHLFRELQVRLVIVDEAQALFAKANLGNLVTNSHFIKTTIINNARVPMVLFGVDDESCGFHAFRKDPQLRRRFRRVDLPQFSYATAEDRLEFRRLLHSIEKHLKVVEPYGLSDSKHAEWAFKITGGRLGAVMRLNRAAAISAIEAGVGKIRRKDIDAGADHAKAYS